MFRAFELLPTTVIAFVIGFFSHTIYTEFAEDVVLTRKGIGKDFFANKRKIINVSDHIR